MTKVTNTSKSARGILIKDGESVRTVHLRPGKSVSGEFDESYLAKLESRNAFKIEDSVDTNDEPDLHKMKVDDLKAFAAANGIELGDATKKDDIIAAIEMSLEA